MNSQLIASAGYGIALAAAFIGFYFWRRSGLLSLQLETLQKTLGQEKTSHAKRAEKISSLEAQLLAKDKELHNRIRERADLEKNRELLAKELSQTQKLLKDSVQSTENQVEHYKTQCETLLVQIRELDLENTQLKKSTQEALIEKETKLARHAASAGEETKKVQNLEAQLKQVQTRLLEVQKEHSESMEFMNRLKRKTYQSDHLYKTIRGQKEMLEERLENWEKALRLLSLWVLNDRKKTISPNASLGEIVSAALDCSKQGPLMCDDIDLSVENNAPAHIEGAASV